MYRVKGRYKHVPNSSFEGFGESCFKGGLLPFATGKPQIVIPGAGDRSFAGISENELGVRNTPAALLGFASLNPTYRLKTPKVFHAIFSESITYVLNLFRYLCPEPVQSLTLYLIL